MNSGSQNFTKDDGNNLRKKIHVHWIRLHALKKLKKKSFVFRGYKKEML